MNGTGKLGDDLRCPEHPTERPWFDEDGPYCPTCGRGLDESFPREDTQDQQKGSHDPVDEG